MCNAGVFPLVLPFSLDTRNQARQFLRTFHFSCNLSESSGTHKTHIVIAHTTKHTVISCYGQPTSMTQHGMTYPMLSALPAYPEKAIPTISPFSRNTGLHWWMGSNQPPSQNMHVWKQCLKKVLNTKWSVINSTIQSASSPYSEHFSYITTSQ